MPFVGAASAAAAAAEHDDDTSPHPIRLHKLSTYSPMAWLGAGALLINCTYFVCASTAHFAFYRAPDAAPFGAAASFARAPRSVVGRVASAKRRMQMPCKNFEIAFSRTRNTIY